MRTNLVFLNIELLAACSYPGNQPVWQAHGEGSCARPMLQSQTTQRREDGPHLPHAAVKCSVQKREQPADLVGSNHNSQVSSAKDIYCKGIMYVRRHQVASLNTQHLRKLKRQVPFLRDVSFDQGLFNHMTKLSRPGPRNHCLRRPDNRLTSRAPIDQTKSHGYEVPFAPWLPHQ